MTKDYLDQRASLCMLIKLIDENNGSIDINTDKVKRAFNDDDNIVKLEYVDGSTALAADADYKTLDDAIKKWIENNSKKFRKIMLEHFQKMANGEI